MKIIPILYTKKEYCCGCSACLAIWQKKAISMVTDTEGFEYPYIDKNKCIGCNKCIKVCNFKQEKFVTVQTP